MKKRVRKLHLHFKSIGSNDRVYSVSVATTFGSFEHGFMGGRERKYMSNDGKVSIADAKITCLRLDDFTPSVQHRVFIRNNATNASDQYRILEVTDVEHDGFKYDLWCQRVGADQ